MIPSRFQPSVLRGLSFRPWRTASSALSASPWAASCCASRKRSRAALLADVAARDDDGLGAACPHATLGPPATSTTAQTQMHSGLAQLSGLRSMKSFNASILPVRQETPQSPGLRRGQRPHLPRSPLARGQLFDRFLESLSPVKEISPQVAVLLQPREDRLDVQTLGTQSLAQLA